MAAVNSPSPVNYLTLNQGQNSPPCTSMPNAYVQDLARRALATSPDRSSTASSPTFNRNGRITPQYLSSSPKLAQLISFVQADGVETLIKYVSQYYSQEEKVLFSAARGWNRRLTERKELNQLFHDIDATYHHHAARILQLIEKQKNSLLFQDPCLRTQFNGLQDQFSTLLQRVTAYKQLVLQQTTLKDLLNDFDLILEDSANIMLVDLSADQLIQWVSWIYSQEEDFLLSQIENWCQRPSETDLSAIYLKHNKSVDYLMQITKSHKSDLHQDPFLWAELCDVQEKFHRLLALVQQWSEHQAVMPI